MREHRGWRALVRENWYRDVWLVVISIACVFAVAATREQARSARMAAASAERVAAEAKVLSRRIDNATKNNCERIHTLTHTLDGFLEGSRPRLVQFGREGTLTRAQLARALRDNTRQRAKLRGADCPVPPPTP